jgi:hypothetical protein
MTMCSIARSSRRARTSARRAAAGFVLFNQLSLSVNYFVEPGGARRPRFLKLNPSRKYRNRDQPAQTRKLRFGERGA